MNNLFNLLVIVLFYSDLLAANSIFEASKLVANYNFSNDFKNQVADDNHLAFEDYAERCNFSNIKDSSVLCLSGRQLGFISHIPIGTKDFPAVTFMAQVYGAHANGFLFSGKQPKKQLDEFVSRGLFFDNGKVYPGIVRNRVNFRLEGIKLKKDQWNIVGVSYNQLDSSIVYFTQDEYRVHKMVFNEPEARLVIGARYDDKNRCTAKVNELWVFHYAFTPQELKSFFGEAFAMAKADSNSTDFNYKVLKFIAGIYYLLAILFMLFQLLFKRKWVLPIGVKQNQLIRKHSKLNEDLANDKSEMLLHEIEQNWTTSIVDSHGKFKSGPTNIDELRTAIKILNQIKYLAPTKMGVINDFSEICTVINSRVQRVFNGSYTILFATFSAPLVLLFYGIFKSSIDWLHFILLLLPAILYVLAAFTPRFLIRKESSANWFSSSINKLLNAFYIPVFNHQEVDNKKSKMSKVNVVSANKTLFYWPIKIAGFVLAVPLSLLIGINNFVRNYLIYR